MKSRDEGHSPDASTTLADGAPPTKETLEFFPIAHGDCKYLLVRENETLRGA